jgi:hypothetical protein
MAAPRADAVNDEAVLDRQIGRGVIRNASTSG